MVSPRIGERGRSMSEPKTIDLDPSEYRRADQPKRREPILAPGWPRNFVRMLGGMALSLTILAGFAATKGVFVYALRHLH
jgi:hypothetical protein